MISFRVDGRSVVPPYLQIVQQVRQALRMGVLDVGDKLPTVREVVAATAINPNTVLKAYRDLAEGREADYDGTAVRIPWVRDGRLEVWMAGYGPKALKMCGEEADGFILQCADPDIARWTIGTVRAAARAAGRDPSALTICIAAPAYVGTDVAHMREQTRWFGGMVGNHVADLVARYGDSGETIPRALTDYIKARDGYDYSHHGKPGNPSAAFVPDGIVDRFCLLGPPERHVDRLQELREIGADNFSIYLMHDAGEATLDAYAERIIGSV